MNDHDHHDQAYEYEAQRVLVWIGTWGGVMCLFLFITFLIGLAF